MTTPIRWGVLGVGSAGRSRTHALRADPRSEVVCGWRGQPGAVELPDAGSLEALLEQVDAVAVCAVDAAHPELIRRALEAGKHVLTEFPLASSRTEGEALLALAREGKRLLHVEHIELLSGTARLLRERASGIQGGELRFTGRPRAGVAHVALANIARLHRAVDAAGLPRGVRIDARGDWLLRGALLYPDFELSFDFQHGEGLPRQTTLSLQTAEGSLVQEGRRVHLDGRELPLPATGGLFAQDQLCASARILDGTAHYVSDDRILDVLGLADSLAP